MRDPGNHPSAPRPEVTASGIGITGITCGRGEIIAAVDAEFRYLFADSCDTACLNGCLLIDCARANWHLPDAHRAWPAAPAAGFAFFPGVPPTPTAPLSLSQPRGSPCRSSVRF